MEEKDLFWEGLKDFLQKVLEEKTFTLWVKPVSPIRFENNRIFLAVPNDISKNFWLNNLLDYILQYSIEYYGVEYEATFIVAPKTAPVSFETSLSTSYIEEPVHYSRDLNLPIEDNQLNPSYTFSTFIVGDGNKMANGAALAICEKPAVVYNPFLIYGGTGLGKTHLMQAIGNEFKRRNPHAKIKYATSESFTNDFISSIQNGQQQEFRDMYRNIDLLLIDDIQFLSNKDKTQEEFFHTFNALHGNNKQIVMTCDRLPNHVANLEERLVSRFIWGLSADITPPDLETRTAILRQKASRDQIFIDAETLNYIANHVSTNVRELEGALRKVLAYSAIKNQDISINLAAEALNTPASQESKTLTTQTILKEVAKFYHVTIEDIKGKKRTQQLVIPRQTAMYLIRELLDLSFAKIAEEIGNRNHSTVMHAYEKVAKQLTFDLTTQQEIATLKKKLQD